MKAETIECGYIFEENIKDIPSNENVTTMIPYGNNSIFKSKIQVKIEIILKRIIDIMASIIGIILLVPLSIIIYIANFIFSERGPLFYTQQRIGKNGKTFKIYKYRSMIVDADEKLKKYLEENEEARKEFEATQKLKNDPRITKVGKILRKTSLDEFPQFINVLKGDMSLIGPRPIVEREIPLFGNKMKIIHSVKPGITGYWAANGRSNTSYKERVDMEAFYAQNYSLKMDMKIFFKTIQAVIKKEGAL